MTESAEDPDEHRPGSLVLPGLASAAGGVLGYRLGGYEGVAAGAFSIPYLAALFQKSADEILADRVRRAEAMMGSAGEAAGLEPDELAELTGRSKRTRFLTDAAIKAAGDTDWPPGVRALGKALAAGLIEADDATIDIPKMILPAMVGMIAPHLQLLDLLVMCRWDGAVGGTGAERIDDDKPYLAATKSVWTAKQINLACPALESALPALIGTLERHGLIEQNDATAEALTNFSQNFQRESGRLNRPGNRTRPITSVKAPPALSSLDAKRITPAQSWSPTHLGTQVLGYYELAAGTIL